MAQRRRLQVICNQLSCDDVHSLHSQPTAASPAIGRKLQSQYDYIVVGAGSAGCVVASRLSEDPSVSVLLIEAGASNQAFRVRSPLIKLADLQNSDLDYQYRTVPQSTIGNEDRVHYWPRGKCLGGCSSINYMAYVRGDPRNYNDWAKQGCEGWSYDELLPFFKKSENLIGKDLGPAHGRGGPLTVSQCAEGDFSGRLMAEKWVEACSNAGLPKVDYNGPVQTGASLLQTTTHKGVRCDTASAFLFDTGALQRSNLTVAIDTHVTRVVVDDSKRATGVMLETKSGVATTINASKEIIVSCGAVGTPQLLMLSGIGPTQELQEHGIECIQDLPVGRNLQDHLMLFMGYKVKPAQQPFSVTLTGGILSALFQHIFYGTGNLSFPPLHGTAFYHSGIPEHDERRGNDTQIHMVAFGGGNGDTMERNFGLAPNGPKVAADSVYSILLLPILVLPQSVGSVKLASADAKKHPLINPQYLSHPRDLEVLVEACKKCRDIVRQSPLADVVEEEITDPYDPVLSTIPIESDDYLRAWVRKKMVTVYHPVGTAKMGAKDDATAVVDPQLRVHGVTGLRVADASVMPTVISGNTNAPSIMIGERCAAFILS